PVGGDFKQPGLKLAVALEGVETSYDCQEDFLGNFFDVLDGEIIAELINEAPRGCIMPVEKLIPGPCLAFETLGQQICFRFGTHWYEFMVREMVLPALDHRQIGLRNSVQVEQKTG